MKNNKEIKEELEEIKHGVRTQTWIIILIAIGITGGLGSIAVFFGYVLLILLAIASFVGIIILLKYILKKLKPTEKQLQKQLRRHKIYDKIAHCLVYSILAIAIFITIGCVLKEWVFNEIKDIKEIQTENNNKSIESIEKQFFIKT